MPWRLAPVLVAACGAAVWLAVAPPAVDLAAHYYRARTPFSIWDGGWYAGHHTPGYSVLFPPLGALVGVKVAGALAAVAAAALFEPLARRRFGRGARFGALWFALATTVTLVQGRLTFMLGLAAGLAALVALDRGRHAVATLLAIVTALASPVAALFLVLAAIAVALVRGRDALSVAAGALAAVLVLAVAFPEGGYEPFATSAFVPLPILALAAAAVVPRGPRALRLGAVLYALAGTAAYLIHTPMGGNAVRLGTILGGPLVLCALASDRRRSFAGGAGRLAGAAVLAGFAWWQISPAVADVEKVSGDPAAQAAYYRPLLEMLARASVGAAPGRVEIPFTRAHWEADYVAPRFPLARGWERQLDIARNPLFYGKAPLTPATYASWLSDHAVNFVALPDAVLDYAGQPEAALIRRGLPYLSLRSTARHWRLYEFTRPHPFVVALGRAEIRATSVRAGGMLLSVRRPGAAVVRFAWSPYWRLRGGCVERAGDWTRIVARRPGSLRLAIDFSPLRVVERGRRCG